MHSATSTEIKNHVGSSLAALAIGDSPGRTVFVPGSHLDICVSCGGDDGWPAQQLTTSFAHAGVEIVEDLAHG